MNELEFRGIYETESQANQEEIATSEKAKAEDEILIELLKSAESIEGKSLAGNVAKSAWNFKALISIWLSIRQAIQTK